MIVTDIIIITCSSLGCSLNHEHYFLVHKKIYPSCRAACTAITNTRRKLTSQEFLFKSTYANAPTHIRHGFSNYSAFIYLWHLQLKLCALRSVSSDLQLQQNVEGRNDFSSLICATDLLSLAWWRLKLPSVLEGDDRVYSVHMERAVPEHSGEIVCVRRVAEFYLMAKSCVLGERVHVSFVINHLNGTRSERGGKDNSWLENGENETKLARVDECAGTYMSIGDVQQVFGSAALVELQLVTNGLLNNDIVGLLRRQNFIDVLCRSHSVHLVGLKKNSKNSLLCFRLNKRHSEADFLWFLEFSLNIIGLTFSVLLSRLMSE